MIEQRYTKSGEDMWPRVGDRKRAWVGHDLGPSGWLVRFYAVEEMEHDYPPTIEMSNEEWVARHAEFGLDLDGRTVLDKVAVHRDIRKAGP